MGIITRVNLDPSYFLGLRYFSGYNERQAAGKIAFALGEQALLFRAEENFAETQA